MAGITFTETCTVAVLLQPPVVPVTVYVVVATGLAVTFAPLVEDKPSAGIHVYVAPPVALSAAEEPAHIVPFEPALMAGGGVTVTVVV